MDGKREHPPASDGGPSALDRALERICFFQWRLEQIEASLQEALRKNQSLRSELTEASVERARATTEQATLTERVARARRELESLEERAALSERARSAAEAHSRQLEANLLLQTRDLGAEAERERQRAEVLGRALSDARARLDELERAHARFFVRLEEWQRLLGADPDQIDLAEFISGLRAEVVRLSQDRELAQRREHHLRLALVQAGAHVPEDALLESAATPTESPRDVPERARLESTATPAESPRDLPDAARLESAAPPVGSPRNLPDDARLECTGSPRDVPDAARLGSTDSPQGVPGPTLHARRSTPEVIGAAPTTAVAQPVASLSEAVKARMTGLSPDDARAALALLPEPVRARARRLLAEVVDEAPDRARAAARGLNKVCHPAAVSAVVVRARRAETTAEREGWIELLEMCGGPVADRALQPYLTASSHRERARAIEALARLRVGAARDDVLLEGIRDPDARVRRRSALEAAAQLGRGSEPMVRPLLEDPCPNTRRVAATILRGRRAAATQPSLATVAAISRRMT